MVLEMLPILHLMSLYLVRPSFDSEHKMDIFHLPPMALIAFCKGHPTVQGQICSFAISFPPHKSVFSYLLPKKCVIDLYLSHSYNAF